MKQGKEIGAVPDRPRTLVDIALAGRKWRRDLNSVTYDCSDLPKNDSPLKPSRATCTRTIMHWYIEPTANQCDGPFLIQIGVTGGYGSDGPMGDVLDTPAGAIEVVATLLNGPAQIIEAGGAALAVVCESMPF